MYEASRAKHASEAKGWITAFGDSMRNASSVSTSSKRMCDAFEVFIFALNSSFSCSILMQTNFKMMQKTLFKLCTTPCPSQAMAENDIDNAQMLHVLTYLGLKDGESIFDNHPIFGASCCNSSRATIFPHGARASGDLAALVVTESEKSSVAYLFHRLLGEYPNIAPLLFF